MKIVIDNLTFDFNIGCRILKMKHKECPASMTEKLGDMWNDIQPLTFQEIARDLSNIEQRRIAMGYLGIDNVVTQINPRLKDRQVLHKTTTWINPNGEMETKEFEDVYELYEVTENALFGNEAWNSRTLNFVKFKCTSTDREYYIWVDVDSVRRTNGIMWNGADNSINSIQAIAWTITTDVRKDNIEKIVRQGDCVLIKKKNEREGKLDTPRHLTEQEYLSLLVAES